MTQLRYPKLLKGESCNAHVFLAEKHAHCNFPLLIYLSLLRLPLGLLLLETEQLLFKLNDLLL